MKCPKCNFKRTQVTDSRDGSKSTYRRRRRMCEKCKYKFTTTELLGIHDDNLPLFSPDVVDRDGDISKFDVIKLRESIDRAFKHSKFNTDTIEKVYETVKDKVSTYPQKKISYSDIDQMIMDELLKISKFIALRYASTHLDFTNEKELFDFINKK